MQTSIENLAQKPCATTFDDPAFRAVLEDHLTWLINHAQTTSVPVTAHQAEIYDFDWVGLLQDLKIPPDLFWLTIRMNGGMSLTDLPSTTRSLKVADYSVVKNLVMLNSSTKRIK